MDFLNKAFAQLSDLFRSMTPGARITAGLLLAVIVISLVYLFNQRITGGDAYLLEGQSFSAADMATMEGAFGKAGLNDYTIEGNRIRVPRGQKMAYLSALADAQALPTNFQTYMMDAASKSGPFADSQQKKDVMKGARESLLSAMISGMQGVEHAVVTFDSERKGGLRRETVKTAWVAVKLKGNRPLEEEDVPNFQRAVAAGIAGMSPQDVTVTDQNSGNTFGGHGADGSSVMDNAYLASMKRYKTLYEDSIRGALKRIAGVTVIANVVLTKELKRREQRINVDPKTVTISSQENTSKSTTKGPEPNGRTGIAAQGGVPNAGATIAGSGKGSESTESSSQSQTENVASHGQTDSEIAPLTPTEVNLSVGIPSSWFESIWRQQNPTPPGEEPKPIDQAAIKQIETEELARIKSLIINQVPRPEGAGVDPAMLVTVVPFTAIPPPETPGPALTDKALAWFGSYWSTLGMAGLVLVSLLMLRSMIRSGPAVPETAASPLRVAAEPAAEQPASAEPPKSRFKRKLGSGPSLRDELVDIVREDPDAAANILRGWIGNVS